jgi:lauroyl/myristoyl acyltransferase
LRRPATANRVSSKTIIPLATAPSPSTCGETALGIARAGGQARSHLGTSAPLLATFARFPRILGGFEHSEEARKRARGILTALHDNEAVGILVDQNTPLEEGAFVDFFGVPACAGTGFAKLAAHSGAAVVPGFALWIESRRQYVLRFYPPIEITGDAEADTRALHRQLEAVVREYPDQWLWIHRRWRTRPR